MVEGCAVKDVWFRELSAYSSWCEAGLNWVITGPVINDILSDIDSLQWLKYIDLSHTFLMLEEFRVLEHLVF